MQPFNNFEALQKTLSQQRLGPYLKRASDELGSTATDELIKKHVITHYLWNMALSEALYPALHLLEVSLRNQIHHAAQEAFGPVWIKDSEVVLDLEMARVQKAIETISKEGKDATLDKIVAEVSFGFWTSLFRREYEVHFTRKILKSTFFYFKERSRGSVSDRLTEIRRLRNRVFHYEPIWHKPTLEKQHRDVLETIGWICPEAATMIKRMDRFETVYASGPKEFNWATP